MIKVEFKINFSKLLEYIKFPRVNIAQERKSKKSILLHSTYQIIQTYDKTFHDIYSKATFITHLFAIINNSSFQKLYIKNPRMQGITYHSSKNKRLQITSNGYTICSG